MLVDRVLLALCIVLNGLQQCSCIIESTGTFSGFQCLQIKTALTIQCVMFNGVFSFLVVPEITQLKLESLLDRINYVRFCSFLGSRPRL